MEQMSMFGCPTAYRSSRITRQTRRESNEKTDRKGMYSMILKELRRYDGQRDWSDIMPTRISVVSFAAAGAAKTHGTDAGRKNIGCRKAER